MGRLRPDCNFSTFNLANLRSWLNIGLLFNVLLVVPFFHSSPFSNVTNPHGRFCLALVWRSIPFRFHKRGAAICYPAPDRVHPRLDRDHSVHLSLTIVPAHITCTQ